MAEKPIDKKSQRDKFIETAREIGCDEDEDAFKARLKTLVASPTTVAKPVEKPKAKKPSGDK